VYEVCSYHIYGKGWSRWICYCLTFRQFFSFPPNVPTCHHYIFVDFQHAWNWDACFGMHLVHHSRCAVNKSHQAKCSPNLLCPKASEQYMVNIFPSIKTHSTLDTNIYVSERVLTC
jgi:hypothetical protein